MLGYFPSPYPDELFYSLCARFADRTQFTSQKDTMAALFGNRNAIATIEMPSYLDHFIDTVNYPEIFNQQTLIFQYSILPIYVPFLPQDRILKIFEDVVGTKGMKLHLRAGLMADGIQLPEYLRFCPICSKADLKEYGEYYWHRIHQVSGVLVCPIHLVILENSNAPRSGSRSRHRFYSAKHFIDQTLPSPRFLSKEEAFMADLAKDAAWLLNHPLTSSLLEKVSLAYRHILRVQGYTNDTGRLHSSYLFQNFQTHFRPEILQKFNSEILSLSENWILRMLRRPNRAYPPIRHLLLINFLGYSADKFFKFLEESENEIKKDDLLPSFPDSNPKREYTSQWEELLRILWNRSDLSLRGISRQLTSDPLTVKRHATRLGLVFPRNGNTCSKLPVIKKLKSDLRAVDHLKQLSKNRRAWEQLIKKKPKLTMKFLGSKQSKLHAWLYRHDRTWLSKHRLPKLKTKNITRVDWKKRDLKISSLIPIAVREILEKPGKPIQATPAEIGRRTKFSGMIQKRKKLLPLTHLEIQKLSEGRIEFALRRIRWIQRFFQQEKISPKTWMIIKYAGIGRLKDHPRIKRALEQ